MKTYEKHLETLCFRYPGKLSKFVGIMPARFRQADRSACYMQIQIGYKGNTIQNTKEIQRGMQRKYKEQCKGNAKSNAKENAKVTNGVYGELQSKNKGNTKGMQRKYK